MIKNQLGRYDNYKDCELKWLNEIPEHWYLERVKNLTSTQSGTTPRSDVNKYYENGTNPWVRTTDLNNNRLDSSEYMITELALNECSLRQIPVNSVLLAMYGGMGTIGKNSILTKEVVINQSVCAVLPHKCFNSTYFWYYVQYFRPHWEMFANSARKDPNINQEEIKRLWITIPPLYEQKSIADYLDTKTAQIDRKIELFTQKANKYGELKQSLINKTVTRGLDKTVTMKDSGIEWIGEVPEHWEVKRVKDISSNIYAGGTPSTTINSYWDRKEIIWLPSGELQNNIIKKHSKNKYISFEGYRNSSTKIINPQTTLIALTGATCANIGYLTFKACANQSVVAISNSKLFDSKYLFYNLLSKRDYIKTFQTGGAQAGINTHDVKFLYSTLPPLPEQKAIADYLDAKTAHIDLIIETINTQIEKLKELRKTLINDVVTGKIKVYMEEKRYE